MKTLITLCAVVIATISHANDIEITDAYALASGPSAKSGAAFMVINNKSTEDVTLIGASTSFSQVAELHMHSMSADGVMQMTAVDGGLIIPSGQCALLERGGYHMMLMGLNQPMIDGQFLPMEVHFQGGERVLLDIKIENMRGADILPTLPLDQESCITAETVMMGEMDHSAH